jgi:peptide deformylase
MILQLTPPHEVTKPPEFDFENPIVDPKELADRLWENMNHYNGVGLSATQVGINTKVFVMGRDDFRMNVFNPQVIQMSDELKAFKEGCLTWPFLMLSIRRPIDCTVSYYTEENEAKTMKLVEMSARIFLHEYDHMLGVDFTQRASKLSLDIGMKKRQKMLKKLEKSGKLINNAGRYELSKTS